MFFKNCKQKHLIDPILFSN